jgi:transposase
VNHFPIFALSADLLVDHIQMSQTIQIGVCSSAPTAVCPRCGSPSSTVQSRYVRTLADLPISGRPVHLTVRVRRFRCHNGACSRRIFAEQFPDLARPHAQRTVRLQQALAQLGVAVGGEVGARLGAVFGLSGSPDTVLRLVRQMPLPPPSLPRVIGVDDWCWRRGRTYGTIIVDHDRHQVIDLLPTRDAQPLAHWLAAHPTVEAVTRDRSGEFAKAIAQGAPQARQIADRWHLFQNLTDALERFFVHRRVLLKQVVETPHHQVIEATPWVQGRTRAMEATSKQRHQRWIAAYQQVHDLAQMGLGVTAIAEATHLSRGSVYKYLRMPHPPERKRCPDTRSLPLDSYKPYLLRRWNDGCRNASQLWKELVAQGYAQSRSTVGRFIAILRVETGKRYSFKQVAPGHQYAESSTSSDRQMTTRQAAGLLVMDPERLAPSDRSLLTNLVARSEEVAQTYQQVQAFCQIARLQHGEQLDAWIHQVHEHGCPELRAFAAGLLKDHQAVRAGLTERYSQGPTEGHVTRLKLIKRQGYGRARFDLLRARVLLSA